MLRMKNDNQIIIPAAVLLLIFLSSGCGKAKDGSGSSEVLPVKTARVELVNILETLDYIGDIKAQDEVPVYPKVSGKIIEKVKEDGSKVEKDDVIAYIDRDEVGLKFEKAPVESPIRGVIGRVYVDKGTSVTPETPVALVVNMDTAKIELNIPEKYIPLVSLGQSAQISLQAYPQEEFVGTVSKISPVLDLDTRSAPIELSIPNSDHRLKSGMFAQVRLIIKEHKDVPAVLKEAIMGKPPQNYVYVVEGGVCRQKSVSLGIRQGAYYEVAKGLKDGDLVVVMGQQKLYDGAKVSAEVENNPAPEGEK
ncbi:MAG: efflux RND transporter periplasmic adaptor subunit [Candidatus Omnitrophota bacterium]